MRLVPTYRRRPSALHAAGAGASSLYCAAFALVAVVSSHPLVLASAAAGMLAAAACSGVRREHARWFWLALPLVALTVIVNALVSQRGLTVVFRGGTVLGHRFDVTAESLAWGAVTGIRIAVLFLACGLYALVVDPDEVLKLARRVSYRSALTASLATRLVPVLARDAARMHDAVRCRPRAPRRLEVLRATLASSLERAVEVAAALEVRGYAAARPPRRAPTRRSRHDARVLAAAGLIAAAAIAGRVGGAMWIHFDPTVRMALDPGTLATCAAIVAAGLAPFATAGARLGVARA